MVAITSNKRQHILEAVNQMYTQVANAPGRDFHFPTGRKACEFVHYPSAVVDGVPDDAVESFAGVGYPFAADMIKSGDTVLDIGSGSGTDVHIALQRVGDTGKVYALDLTQAMRTKLQRNLQRGGITNVEILTGNAESIPLDDNSVDVVTSNGVLNLVPDKALAISEIFRVLKPGGRLQLADIALKKPIAERFRQDPELWAECVVGAVSEDSYLEMLRAAGFRDVEIVDHLDYFSGSNSEKTREVAGLFGAHSIVLRAVKPTGEELGKVTEEQTSWRRRAGGVVRHGVGIAMAGVAAAACMGSPLVLGLFATLGIAALASHAYAFPLFVAFAAATTWSLHREGRRRGSMGPFWLGLAASATTSILLWLMITGIWPLPVWLVFMGLGVLLIASIWCLLQPLQPDRCVDEMVRYVERHDRPLQVRLTRGALLSVSAAAAFYGMYKSIDTFAPTAEAGDIACYGINACKGQTACMTAFNGCPGQNSCKGKGFLNVSKKECSERGGQPLKGSPADPANASS